MYNKSYQPQKTSPRAQLQGAATWQILQNNPRAICLFWKFQDDNCIYKLLEDYYTIVDKIYDASTIEG